MGSLCNFVLKKEGLALLLHAGGPDRLGWALFGPLARPTGHLFGPTKGEGAPTLPPPSNCRLHGAAAAASPAVMLPPLGPCGHREAPPRAAVACAPGGAATSCAAAKRCGRGPLLLARVLRQAKRRCRRGLLCVPLLVLCAATKSRHPLPRRSASAGGAARPCRAPPRSAPWSDAVHRWWSAASPPHSVFLLASIRPPCAPVVARPPALSGRLDRGSPARCAAAVGRRCR